MARIKSAWSFVQSRALPTPHPNSIRPMTTFPLGHWCFPGAGEHSAVKWLSCLPREHHDAWDMPPLCHALYLVNQETCWEMPPHRHAQMLPCCGRNCSKDPPSQYLAQVYLLRKKSSKEISTFLSLLYSSLGKEKGQQKRGGEGKVTCHFWTWARQTVLATAVHRRSVWQVSESLLWDRKFICSTFMLFISFDFSVNWEFLASRRTLGTDAYELSWGGRQRANIRGPYAALPMGPSCKI